MSLIKGTLFGCPIMPQPHEQQLNRVSGDHRGKPSALALQSFQRMHRKIMSSISGLRTIAHIRAYYDPAGNLLQRHQNELHQQRVVHD